VDVSSVRTIARRKPGYPRLLSELHDPPATLFVRGDAGSLSEPGVAVVGARSCSAYGAQVARSLARELASVGLVVVSGLARGIDGEAHRGALEGGGRTVAVLGCGIDRDYPRSHAELARRIVTSGAVVSEYASGVEPAPWRFPARNRWRVGVMRDRLNHAIRPCRLGREMPCPCGPGVVSQGAFATLVTAGVSLPI
jgi:DNA processing protein